MKIALAHINQKIATLEENTKVILNFAKKAKEQGADVIIFPEFSVTGGYCNDLFNNKDFIVAEFKEIEKITSQISLPTIAGVITNNKLNQEHINSVAFFDSKKYMEVVASKYVLNDGFFNDLNYFKFAGFSNVFKLHKKNIACVIADSISSIATNLEKVSLLKIDIAVILSCSPYYKGKFEEVKTAIKISAKKNSIDVVYVNMLGANDGYFFDGQSLYVDKNGNFKAIGNMFEEGLTIVDTEGQIIEDRINDKTKELYDVLVLSLRDYLQKNSFTKCILGVSGGIDSALTLAIAADAIGAENVIGVLMPSKYTSKESIDYSLELCKNLKVKTKTIAINEIYDVYIKNLTPFFENKEKNLTEENLQARIRSNILMALSNKFGYLVLCTGNKSEDAVGYSTLYGDATGGYAPISDLLKKEVYELSKYRNTISKVIPNFIITRPPTAELRENQKDSDSLPEYDILDDILEKILDRKMTYEQIVDSGINSEILNKVWKMLKNSEYKRRQSPIGTKVSKSAFLRDVNFPISNGYIWKPVKEKNLCQKIKDIDKE